MTNVKQKYLQAREELQFRLKRQPIYNEIIARMGGNDTSEIEDVHRLFLEQENQQLMDLVKKYVWWTKEVLPESMFCQETYVQREILTDASYDCIDCIYVSDIEGFQSWLGEEQTKRRYCSLKMQQMLVEKNLCDYPIFEQEKIREHAKDCPECARIIASFDHFFRVGQELQKQFPGFEKRSQEIGTEKAINEVLFAITKNTVFFEKREENGAMDSCD